MEHMEIRASSSTACMFLACTLQGEVQGGQNQAQVNHQTIQTPQHKDNPNQPWHWPTEGASLYLCGDIKSRWTFKLLTKIRNNCNTATLHRDHVDSDASIFPLVLCAIQHIIYSVVILKHITIQFKSTPLSSHFADYLRTFRKNFFIPSKADCLFLNDGFCSQIMYCTLNCAV